DKPTASISARTGKAGMRAFNLGRARWFASPANSFFVQAGLSFSPIQVRLGRVPGFFPFALQHRIPRVDFAVAAMARVAAQRLDLAQGELGRRHAVLEDEGK